MHDSNDNNVTIEKLDTFTALHEKIPFAVLPCRVLQNLNDGLALGIWCYLQSLPPNWQVSKFQIKRKFGIGHNKCKEIFSLLHKLNLIDYLQLRSADGKLGEFAILIKNGSEFLLETPTGGTEIEPPVKAAPMLELAGGTEIEPPVKKRNFTGGTENRPAVNRTTGFETPNNINIKNTIEKNNNNNFAENKEKTKVIVGDIHDKNLLRSRITYPCHEDKTDEEFLLMCKFSIEHNPIPLTLSQKVAGILKIMAMGTFDEPVGYVSPIHKKTVNEAQDYNEFVSKVKADIRLKMVPRSTKIPTIDEWRRNGQRR